MGVYVYVCVCIYIYIEKERERQKGEGVSKMLTQTSRVVTHTSKERKFTSIYFDKHLAFEVETSNLQNSFYGNS
jgi:hypothetical protein